MFVGYNYALVPKPEYDGDYLLDPCYEWHSVEKEFNTLLECLQYVSRVLSRLTSRPGEVILDGIGVYTDDGTAIYYWSLDM